MSFNLVAHRIDGLGALGGTSGNLDTTTANLLLVVVATFSTGPTVSDSKSNTWNALTAQSGSGNLQAFWSAPISVGSGHNFTTNGTFSSIWIGAYSGAHASPFDVENGSVGSNQPGSVTPANASSLLVCASDPNNDVSPGPTINLSFVKQDFVAAIGGVQYGLCVADLILDAATPTNPTWTPESSSTSEAVIAVFRGQAGGVALLPFRTTIDAQ